MRAQFGTGRPDWFLSIPFLSNLYVDDGWLFDVRNRIRQHSNTLMWGSIAFGLLGPKSLNLEKLDEEGHRCNIRTMLGFEIDSRSPRITPPEAKIDGARVLFDQLEERGESRVLDVVILQEIRGHIEHFRASNALWNFLTGPIDLLLRYTDEKATWEISPIPEVWGPSRNSLSVIFDIAQSESHWEMFPS